MFTNTYLPQVGGVACSVDRFAQAFRERGHQVLVVAPSYDDQPDEEEGVLRVPAVQNLNGSDFSMALPAHPGLARTMDAFDPEIIHTHHPFLLGTTALREAAAREIPIVFTCHSRYEFLTSYVPLEIPQMRAYAVKLTTGFANLCDAVIAPSESISDVLRERGVKARVAVIPTGLNLERFATGDGDAVRRRMGIPDEAFTIGHVGRLGPEKNLGFLSEAVARAMSNIPTAHFLVVGSGEARAAMEPILAPAADRVHFAGTLCGDDLRDAYHAMDVFVFASTVETQGVVLTEALAAGRPVVALDAPGAREVVDDEHNGRLLAEEDADEFADAIAWARAELDRRGEQIARQARKSAEPFATDRCAEATLDLYCQTSPSDLGTTRFDRTLRPLLQSIRNEWEIWSNRLEAAAGVFSGDRSKSEEEQA